MGGRLAADPARRRRLSLHERHADQPAALCRTPSAAPMRGCSPGFTCCCGSSRRRRWSFSASPICARPGLNATQGRVTSSALVVLGVGAAYAYSAFAMIEGSEQVYFDTATMVLMLFTVGSYIEAAGRAKAARDLEPLLAAESECATVVDEGGGDPPPGARDRRRHAGAGPAGRAHSGRRRGRRGRIPHRRSGDHRREPASRQGRRLRGDRRQHQSRRPAADPKQRRREPQPAGRRSAGRCATRCPAAARLSASPTAWSASPCRSSSSSAG